MRKIRPSDAVKADLEKAKADYESIEAKIKQAESAIELLKSDQKSLYGYGRSGRIPELEAELERSIQFEKDVGLIPVVWMGPGSGIENAVIKKVTAKTIFVKKRGEPDTKDKFWRVEYRFSLDGRSPGFPQIDIRKTFGIDSDSVPPNWNPGGKNAGE